MGGAGNEDEEEDEMTSDHSPFALWWENEKGANFITLNF